MYIPSYYRNSSAEQALDFIRANSFGIMVYKNEKGDTEAVHSPFLVQEENGVPVLYTHIARIPGRITAGEVLCIFSGAHGYVSPVLYTSEKNVPTWNYSALHVYGEAEEQGPEHYPDFMTRLVEFYDPAWLGKWKKADPAYIEGLYRGIILLRIPLQRFDFANKWNQNKPEQDRRNVAAHFRATGNAALAEDMRRSIDAGNNLDGEM
ncbi:MAG: FMN-binding negative transcriptional regulator [Flavobacteriales bacterium]